MTAGDLEGDGREYEKGRWGPVTTRSEHARGEPRESGAQTRGARRARRDGIAGKILAMVVGACLLGPSLGCGADPGGDFLDDGFGPGLPIGGVAEEIQLAYQQLAGGSHTAARGKFLAVVDDNPTTQEASQAWAGIGFVDTRQLGTAEGLVEFEKAWELDDKNPDARVGLAGALISRGQPADIDRAIDLLRGLDPGNENFVYQDRFDLGITNAEVHALLAYALRVDGQTAASNVQRGIAQQLDANVDDTTVDQILSVLAFLP